MEFLDIQASVHFEGYNLVENRQILLEPVLYPYPTIARLVTTQRIINGQLTLHLSGRPLTL
jgi:hypothetical protein